MIFPHKHDLWRDDRQLATCIRKGMSPTRAGLQSRTARAPATYLSFAAGRLSPLAMSVRPPSVFWLFSPDHRRVRAGEVIVNHLQVA